MKREHFTFEERKFITSMISKGSKCKEIALFLDKDATSISKEVKRNRYISKCGKEKEKICKKTLRWPYVCTSNCPYKYSICTFSQFRYEAKAADEKARARLVKSRVGLNIDEEEFKVIDEIVKNGINNKESVYHIVKSNENMPSVPTIYRWIKDKKLSTHYLDLPYACTYKKRKQRKKYNYANNKIDRVNRTFLDYLEFRRNFPGNFVVQMDFLGSIVADSNSILTFTIPELHFVYLRIINHPTKEKIINLFNELEDKLGISNFSLVFNGILTDRDPCFIDFMSIEFSPKTGEQRTHIFYCDPYCSSQKGNVENMNKQLRKYFPKKRSIDNFTDEEVKEINNIINNAKVASLGGFSPNDAFVKVYNKAILDALFNY